MTERSGRPNEDDVIEVADLPSLPDGGLSANMPSWLRHAPSFNLPAETPSSTVDLGSLTSGLHLPEWLSELSARVERGDADAVIAWSNQTAETDIVPAPADAPESPLSPAGEIETESAPLKQEPIPLPPVRSVDHELARTPATELHSDPPYRRIGVFLLLFILGVIAFTIWSATN